MTIIPVKDDAEWRTIRAQHIGGSEVAALFGESPYGSPYQFWHTKAGNIPPADLSDNERVQAGTFMEPAIAAWAAAKWGVNLQKFQGYAVHDTVQGMGCTPDYWEPEQRILVQIKNVDGFVFRDKENPSKIWEAEGEVLTDAPLHILLQVQHELACTGFETAWLVVCVGGNTMYRMEITRRPATIAKLEQAVAAFWQSVRDGKEPPVDYTSDYQTIAALYGDTVPKKKIDLSTNNRAHEVAAAYLRGHAMEAEGNAIKQAAKAELITLLGDAEIATIGDFIAKATRVKENKGKKITAAMLGMIQGARKAYRIVSVEQKLQPEGV